MGWEKTARKSIQTLIDSLYLSGLLLVNLLLATVLIVLLKNWVPIEIIAIPIRNTDGIYWILASVGLVVSFIFFIDRSDTVRRQVKDAGLVVWRVISHVEREDLDGDNLQEFEDIQTAYVEEFSKALPLILLGLIAPGLLVYTYTKPFNLAALSILYIIFGIIFGSVKTAFMRHVVFLQKSDKHHQRMGEAVSKQMEVILLIFGAFAQLMNLFDVGVSNLGQILATFGLSILAAGPAFILFFYFSPPISVVDEE